MAQSTEWQMYFSQQRFYEKTLLRLLFLSKLPAWMWVREPDPFGLGKGFCEAAGARVAQARCGGEPLAASPSLRASEQ